MLLDGYGRPLIMSTASEIGEIPLGKLLEYM